MWAFYLAKLRSWIWRRPWNWGLEEDLMKNTYLISWICLFKFKEVYSPNWSFPSGLIKNLGTKFPNTAVKPKKSFIVRRKH